MPIASRIMIGVCGLFFFMVGYARVRNDLRLPVRISSVFDIRYQANGFLHDLPDGIGVLAGLAVKEAQLLQRLGEGIFARHGASRTPEYAKDLVVQRKSFSAMRSRELQGGR